MPTCTGNPTFELSSSSSFSAAFSEWPSKIPGLVCKTPPIGMYSAPRFAQCCSGPVYNVTSPTNAEDDAAYPVSCATLCQVAPEFNAVSEKNPYGFSDHYMCLTDGGALSDDGWEVVCDTLSVDGVAAPTSYASTPTGAWQTTAPTSSSSEESESTTTTSEPDNGSSSTTVATSNSLSSSGERPSSTSTDYASETSVPSQSSAAVATTTSKPSTDTTETASLAASSTSGASRLTITAKNAFAGVILLMAAWCSSSSVM